LLPQALFKSDTLVLVVQLLLMMYYLVDFKTVNKQLVDRYCKRVYKNQCCRWIGISNFPSMIVCSIFILLSRKSDGGAVFGRIRTRLGVAHFQVFRLFLWIT